MKGHCIRFGITLWIVAGVACVDRGYNDLPPDHVGRSDAVVGGDDAGSDATNPQPDADPDLDYRPLDEEGPEISFISPQAQQVLAGERWQVEALVSDPDGVDPTTVEVWALGGDSAAMIRGGVQQDQFNGTLELGSLESGAVRIVVQAADLQGHLNSAEVLVQRDQGPAIEVVSPVPQERYGAHIGVSVLMNDGFGLVPATVAFAVDGVAVQVASLQRDTLHGDEPRWMLFGGTVDLQEAQSDTPLTGLHQLTVTAANINGVSQTVAVPFLVDLAGPDIVVTTPQPGQIVGGVVEIVAEVDDDAGVAADLVVAVVAHDSVQYTVDLTLQDGAYRGTFDSKLLPTAGWYYPSVSVRAADLLHNESQVGFLVALDNASPLVELDPTPVSGCVCVFGGSPPIET